MRVLASCPTCQRQYDAAGLKPGAHFHCACGAVATVPNLGEQHRDALHCAACGAARRAGAAACTYCRSPFADGDLSRETTCPGCFARIRDDAKFCDHCGVAIRPQALAATSSEFGCPVCGPAVRLRHRALPEPATTVDECPTCGGLWLDSASFAEVIERTRQSAPPTPRQAPPRVPQLPTSGALYRPCPYCTQLMHRQNYQRRSGVIVDVCKDHGIWFDADELAHVLVWVRAGGLEFARAERDTEEKQERQRRPPSVPTSMGAGFDDVPVRSGEFLPEMIEAAFGAIGWLFRHR